MTPMEVVITVGALLFLAVVAVRLAYIYGHEDGYSRGLDRGVEIGRANAERRSLVNFQRQRNHE